MDCELSLLPKRFPQKLSQYVSGIEIKWDNVNNTDTDTDNDNDTDDDGDDNNDDDDMMMI